MEIFLKILLNMVEKIGSNVHMKGKALSQSMDGLSVHLWDKAGRSCSWVNIVMGNCGAPLLIALIFLVKFSIKSSAESEKGGNTEELRRKEGCEVRI